MSRERPDLFLDRDGQFFFKDAPCVRRDITDRFFAHLEPDPDGGYRIRIGSDVARVEVAEAPLRVHNLLREPNGSAVLCLDGGLVEPFLPGTLRFAGSVPWCRARGLDARFTPTAALALLDVVQEEGDVAFVVAPDGTRVALSPSG